MVSFGDFCEGAFGGWCLRYLNLGICQPPYCENGFRRFFLCKADKAEEIDWVLAGKEAENSGVDTLTQGFQRHAWMERVEGPLTKSVGWSSLWSGVRPPPPPNPPKWSPHSVMKSMQEDGERPRVGKRPGLKRLPG